MARRKWTTITALAAAGALALTACARTTTDEDASVDQQEAIEQYYTPGFYEQEAPGEPTRGGTLTYADFNQIRGVDPATGQPGTFGSGTPMTALYDNLIRWNQRTQEFEPRLAESIESNDDYTEWTIRVRPGVEFTDGTPVNADAVIGSMNYFIENRGQDMGVIGPLWGGVEKVDDLTVQVNLRHGWASFPFALGLGMGFIVAPAAIEGGPDNFEPIGAGPFMFESFSPQEELVLVKNPNYWDGEPYLDSVRIVWLGADQTKYETLQTGNVHAAVVRDTNVLRDARDAETSGYVWTENFGNMFVLNRADGRPVAEYPQLAPAIAHALDEEALYDRVYEGLGLPSKHLFGPMSPWYNEDAEPKEYDPERAAQLVEEAKAAGFDGKLTMNGIGDPLGREQALAIKAQLDAVGFEIETELARTVVENMSRVLIERDFEFAVMGLSLSDDDPYWRLFAALHSESAANASSYSDPEYDALIEELRVTEGEDRRDVLNRIEDKFLTDLPTIPFASNANMVMWNDNVHGILPSNDQQLALEKAWISN